MFKFSVGRVSLSAAVFSLFAAGVMAGVNSWTTNGPTGGGDITVLAIAPGDSSRIYAGTGAGLFRSADGGATWSSANTGLTSLRVQSIAVAASDSLVAYVGFNGGGVSRTTDGGATWTGAGSGAGGPVSALAVDPADAATVYAGGGFRGISKTTNSGATWISIVFGLPDSAVSAIVIDPSNPSIVYAALYAGVYKTSNGGTSWSATGALPPFGLSLVIDPAAPSTLYVGTANSVHKTTNGGASWVAVTTGLPAGSVWDLAIAGNGSAVYAAPSSGVTGAGVAKTTNGGASWSVVNTGLPSHQVGALAVTPGSASTAYAGTYGRDAGVSKTTNGGTSWTRVNVGLRALTGAAVVFAPSDATILYAAATGGAFKSIDAGATWSRITTGLPDARIMAIAVHPTAPATAYAATAGAGVYKTTNGGASWFASNAGHTTQQAFSIAIAPSDPDTLYTATWGRGLFRSTDAGATWTATAVAGALNSLYVVAVNPTDAQHVYIGGSAGYIGTSPDAPGYSSADGGTTWTYMQFEVGSFEISAGAITSIAFDPVDPNFLYATSPRAVYRTHSAGAYWYKVLGNGGARVTVDPNDRSRLFAATGAGIRAGVITTFGSSFSTSWSDLGTVAGAADVAVDPANGARILVAGAGGVFEYTITDATPPQTTITSAPPSYVSSTSVTVAFASNEAGSTFTCALDGAAPATCTSPLELSSLAEGSHTVSVVATDAAGNADPTPATAAFHVDIAPPETSIDSGPTGTVTTATVTFTFSGSDVGGSGVGHLTCKLDGFPLFMFGFFGACSSPLDLGPLSDGLHLFTVAAVDQAGNIDPTPATRSFTVAVPRPIVTVQAVPPDAVAPSYWYNSASSGTDGVAVRVSAAADAGVSGIRCSTGAGIVLDTFGVVPHDNGTFTLGDGRHYVNCVATDTAGVTGSAHVNFFIDQTAPALSLAPARAPDSGTWYRSPVIFNVTASDTTSFIDATACPSAFTFGGPAGHGVAAIAACADRAANVKTAAYMLDYDAAPPAVAVIGVSEGASYVTGFVPVAGCATTDATSGVSSQATVAVTGGLPDGTGAYTATCAGGTDAAGNVAAPVSVHYVVQAPTYATSGFLSPLANPPGINSGRAGRVLPVKFQVSASGAVVTDLAAVTSITYRPASCSAFPTDPAGGTPAASPGGSRLRVSDGQFIFNWDAPRDAGCYSLFVQFNDGTRIQANFNLTR